MKKIVKELAEQALEIVSNKRLLKDGQMERTWNPHEYDQVFAELIVKECAAVALREDNDPADCILAHFGLLNTAKPQRPGPLDSSYPDGDGYWK